MAAKIDDFKLANTTNWPEFIIQKLHNKFNNSENDLGLELQNGWEPRGAIEIDKRIASLRQI